MPGPEQERWLPALNLANETIPPFSLVKVTGCDLDGMFTLGMPDSDGMRAWITGPFAIQANGTGCVTRDWPAFAKYDSTGNVTPEPGEEWGAANGSWLLTSGKSGFTILGNAATTEEVVQVEAAAGAGNLTIPYHNLLINGNFNVFQRAYGLGNFTSGCYTYDRWFTLHDAANVTFSWANTSQDFPSGTKSYARIVQKTGGNAGVLIGQWLPVYRTVSWAGDSVTLSITAKTDAGNLTLKMAAFERGITDGSIAIVDSWLANVPTFNTSNTTELGNGSLEVTDAEWLTGTLSFVMPDADHYPIVAFWVEGLANNTSLFLAKASLSPYGSYWSEPEPHEEWLRCSEFFYRPGFSALPHHGTFSSNITANSPQYFNSFYQPLPTIMRGSGNLHFVSAGNKVSILTSITEINITHLPSAGAVTSGNQSVAAGNLTISIGTQKIRDNYSGIGVDGYRAFSIQLNANHTGFIRATGNTTQLAPGDLCSMVFRDDFAGPRQAFALTTEIGE